MREEHLPLHHTSAEENRRVRPAGDSGDGVVHIPRELVTSPSSRDSKLDRWLLTAAVVSVTTLFTALYSICKPGWVPSLVAQTVKMSKQRSADSEKNPSTTGGGTAVTVAAGVHGAHGRNAATAATAATNQGFNEGGTSPVTGMPKAADARTSKSKNDFLVPPPPATPCLLPPALLQAGQQDAALQQAQSQASSKTHNQTSDGEDTGQEANAAPGKTEASQSAALDAADQELQAAVKSSLRTVGDWTR